MVTELPAWLVDAMPEELRTDVRLGPSPPGARDLRLEIGSHVVDVSLADEVARTYRRQGELCFGYRVDGDGADPEAARRVCDEIADALAGRAGGRLAALLRSIEEGSHERSASSVAEDPRGRHREMLLGEDALRRGRGLVELERRRDVDQVEVFLRAAACDQACEFCAYPILRAREHTLPARMSRLVRGISRLGSDHGGTVEWIGRILAVLRGRSGSRIVLSGPDCTRHPQFDEILDLFTHEREVELELLGPLTTLADPERFARVAALPAFRGITTSLLSHRAEVHDRMVGRPGAHALVLRAIDNCRSREIDIAVNVLISPRNVADLPDLLELCHARGVTTNLTVYHPETAKDALMQASWRQLALPELVVGPRALARAWAATPRAVLAAARAHYLPRCWVPADLRERLLRPGEDRQDNFVHPPACGRCSERGRCAGITVPAAEVLGPECVSPIE